MMQYIGDLAYLFSIYVNVSTFIQSIYRIKDTTLSRIFAAYFWVFFFFGGNLGGVGGTVGKCGIKGDWPSDGGLLLCGSIGIIVLSLRACCWFGQDTQRLMLLRSQWGC